MGRKRTRASKSGRISSSDSDNSVSVYKPKRGRNRGKSDTLNVSDILTQTNSVLFEDTMLDDSQANDECFETTNTAKDGQNHELSSKMASNASLSPTNGSNTTGSACFVPTKQDDKLDTLLAAVSDIKKNQEGMKKMFESKLDKLRSDLMENVDTKVRALRDELSMDLSREGGRIDNILRTIQTMQGRLDTIETTSENQTPSTNGDNNGIPTRNQPISDPLRDNDLCIIASGISVTDNENLMEKATAIIQALGEDVSSNVLITGAKRSPAHFENRPPWMKISFQNLQEKVLVLRNKMTLRDSHEYKEVYLKSCKSHAERLIELNARAVLRQLPDGRNLRVDVNGRIKQRTNQAPQH